MNTEEAKKDFEEKQKLLDDAFKKLGETQKMLMEKVTPKEQKGTVINNEQAKVAITASGTVMIQFVSFEEAKKYFDKV